MFKEIEVRGFGYIPDRKGVEAGSRKMPKRIHKVGKHGEDVLETVGFTDIYEERQASKDSVDINKLVERYLAGDLGCLDKCPGLYLDLTMMPENIHEMKNVTLMAEQYFATLPAKEREKYEDVEDFLAKCEYIIPGETKVEKELEGGEVANE